MSARRRSRCSSGAICATARMNAHSPGVVQSAAQRACCAHGAMQAYREGALVPGVMSCWCALCSRKNWQRQLQKQAAAVKDDHSAVPQQEKRGKSIRSLPSRLCLGCKQLPSGSVPAGSFCSQGLSACRQADRRAKNMTQQPKITQPANSKCVLRQFSIGR
jgi:hypothetical protein